MCVTGRCRDVAATFHVLRSVRGTLGTRSNPSLSFPLLDGSCVLRFDLSAPAPPRKTLKTGVQRSASLLGLPRTLAYQESFEGGLVARGRGHIGAGPVVGQMSFADEGRVVCEECG